MWQERHQARLAARPRKRAVGAGAKHRLVLVDRLLDRLVHLRHGVTPTCWPAGSERTILRSPGPSVRCGPSSPSEAALPAPTCGCVPWPTSSTTSPRAERPASSTARRSGFAARLSDARARTSSSAAGTSKTPSRPWSSRTAKAASCGAARPGAQAARTSLTPVSWGWSGSWPASPRWGFSPMPATRAWARRPAAGWSHHRTTSSRRTPRAGTKRGLLHLVLPPWCRWREVSGGPALSWMMRGGGASHAWRLRRAWATRLMKARMMVSVV
ncbi:hypothetical protein SAMN05428941_0123 [Streptomyces sp. 2114.2]|nr:hypothetical protein BX268_0119 [Streptomyces sp. 2221.1]SDS24407.1 hypothetical protein SAMN05428941_0123 [Streptomyces sp. 2114.2]